MHAVSPREDVQIPHRVPNLSTSHVVFPPPFQAEHFWEKNKLGRSVEMFEFIVAIENTFLDGDDMDAELLLADMEFNEDDTAENVRLKESVIELYNARLDERQLSFRTC